MASRNRTREFKSMRDGFDRRRARPPAAPSAAAGGAAGHKTASVAPAHDFQRIDELTDAPRPYSLTTASTTASGLPPAWVDTSEEVAGLLRELDGVVAKLDEAHKDRLMIRFDDSSENGGPHRASGQQQQHQPSREDAVNALTALATRKLRLAGQRVKALGEAPPGAEEGQDGAKVRLNVQRALATRLNATMQHFRKSQKDYLARLQALEGAPSLLPTGDDRDPEDPRRSQQLLLDHEDAQALVQNRIDVTAREREIEKIAKSVEELAVLFRNLAQLVVDQGTLLDRVDYNMELVVDQTAKGVEELIVAEKYANSNRANYCVVVFVILDLVLLAVLSMKLS